MEFDTIRRPPSIEEYNALRAAAQWPVFEPHLVEEALRNTLFAVCIRSGKKTVGMGRVIGDNAIYLHIQDVIVHPAFQRQGVGTRIMHELLGYIAGAGGKHTNIGLMCSKGREAFYEAFGFEERPGQKYGAGMIMVRP